MAKNNGDSNLGCLLIVLGIFTIFIPVIGLPLILIGIYLMPSGNSNKKIVSTTFTNSTNRSRSWQNSNSTKPILKNNSFINISSIRTPLFSDSNPTYTSSQWTEVKKRISFSNNQIFWIDKLFIPYKRAILSIKQCEDETIKLYLNLVERTDQYLKLYRNTDLNKLVNQLNLTGGYYDNILYSLECIAESEVGNFYKTYDVYNSGYSYELLEKHIDKAVIPYLKAYLQERVKLIALPNEETSRLMPPISSNLKLHKQIQNTLKNKGEFSEVPFRINKFLETIQTQEETAKVYLRLVKVISTNLNNIDTIEPKLKEFLSSFVDKSNRTYRYNWDKDKKLKICLHKIAEDVVRKSYKTNSLPSLNSAYQDLKNLLKVELSDLIKRESIDLESQVTPPSLETIAHLSNTNQVKAIDKLLISESKERKVIKIDSTKVDQITKENDNTVTELNKYLETEEDASEIVINQNIESLDDIFIDNSDNTKIEFNNLEYNFLKMFVDNNYLISNEEVDLFIKSNKQLKSSFIDNINQKFYTSYNDSLINEAEDSLRIDEYYIDILNNLIHA